MIMDPDQRRQFVIRAAAIAVNIAVEAAIIYSASHYDRIPYHTSALTGAAWVQELMNGHPERIRCELGVHLQVFKLIIEYLKIIGHTHSRDVFLEEQLAIFLYRCTTGLSIRHVGERFQRSNETISRCVFTIIIYLYFCLRQLNSKFMPDILQRCSTSSRLPPSTQILSTCLTSVLPSQNTSERIPNSTPFLKVPLAH
jgi:hypothetical protein